MLQARGALIGRGNANVRTQSRCGQVRAKSVVSVLSGTLISVAGSANAGSRRYRTCLSRELDAARRAMLPEYEHPFAHLHVHTRVLGASRYSLEEEDPCMLTTKSAQPRIMQARYIGRMQAQTLADGATSTRPA